MKHMAIFYSIMTEIFYIEQNKLFNNEEEAEEFLENSKTLKFYGLIPYPTKPQLKKLKEEKKDDKTR